MTRALLGTLALLLLATSLPGQDIPPGSHPFDEMLQQMKFDQPTRIAGRFRSLDGYDDAVWIDWTHRHDGSRWVPVRNDVILKLTPRDGGMMEFFRTVKPGSSLHLTVQDEQDGSRRILELEGV
jgi:hypothetical protein